MRVWAVCNQKGGVGKTTTVANLGGLLAERGQRTLLVDLDPHGSLTAYFGLSPDVTEGGGYELFRARILRRAADPLPYLEPTQVERLELLPASIALATVERQAGALEGLGLVIAKAVRQLAERYDYVLIDSPPSLGILMVNALAACDHLIIPVMADFLALHGLERMLHTLGMISRARKLNLPYTIVPTLYDPRPRVVSESLALLKARHGLHLWPGVIPIDTKLREASRAHLPICRYWPRSRAALAYAELLKSLLAVDRTLEAVRTEEGMPI
jgi:chromosome partitioning protein